MLCSDARAREREREDFLFGVVHFQVSVCLCVCVYDRCSFRYCVCLFVYMYGSGFHFFHFLSFIPAFPYFVLQDFVFLSFCLSFLLCFCFPSLFLFVRIYLSKLNLLPVCSFSSSFFPFIFYFLSLFSFPSYSIIFFFSCIFSVTLFLFFHINLPKLNLLPISSFSPSSSFSFFSLSLLFHCSHMISYRIFSFLFMFLHIHLLKLY